MEEEKTEQDKTADWLKAVLANRDKESLELIDSIVANIVKLWEKEDSKYTQTNWWWVFILFLLNWGGNFCGNWGSDLTTKEENNGNTSN